MKSKSIISIETALLLSVFSFQLSAFSQGSLTPPAGPITPTMVTLSQVQPRTAITNTSSQVTISQPGSYYLTHNLTVSTGDAIDINTNGVTLDLNGFTISSTAASAAGTAILLNRGWKNITIVNGFIQGGVTNNGSGVYGGGGFAYGIYYSVNSPVNVLVSHVSVSGCLNYGIFLNSGDSTVVEACTARTVGSYGIVASTIKSCSAIDCGNEAIAGDQVSDCRGQSSGGIGLYATTALNCYGYSNSGYGLDATTAQNCFGSGNGSGYGLDATTALNCYGYSNGSVGLYATTTQNCYGVSSSGYGLYTVTAESCYGYSYGSGYGLYAYATASGCYGYSNSGTGLYAFIANVCHGTTSTGTALSATHNVNSY